MPSLGPKTMTGSPPDTSEPPVSEYPGRSPRFVQVMPSSLLVYTPDVPTRGKNEQLVRAAVVPRTGPCPHGGGSCSSLEPAMT